MLSLAGWTKKVTGVPVIAVGSVGLQTQFRSEKQGEVIAPAAIDEVVSQFQAGEFDVIDIGADASGGPDVGKQATKRRARRVQWLRRPVGAEHVALRPAHRPHGGNKQGRT